jgi:hypothetical protein
MMMAIAYGDEKQRLGTRPTRMRTGQEYAHTNRNEEPELPRDEVPKLLAMLLTRAMVPKPKGEALV